MFLLDAMSLLNIFLSKKQIDEKLQRKQLKTELTKVNQAKAYINEWNDIPMSWLYPQLCKIMEIRNDKAGQSFCMDLMFQETITMATKLLQIRTT
jgi:hypothetical protein